jgi:PGF-pre-PGF domain-containing protein
MVLFTILISIAFVYALTNPTVISPTTGQNVSGNLLLNATIDANNVTNVTFYFYDSTTNALTYNLTIVNDTVDDTEFNSTIVTSSVLVDGTYNLTVNATNSTSNITTNISVTGVTIDNAAPLVTANVPLASTWYSANFTVNLTVSDATIGVDNTSVQYRVLNSTGTNVTDWITLTLGSGFYTATFDITSQVNAENYTFEFNASDSLSNSNATVNVTGVHIDNTSPAINSLSVGILTASGGVLTVNSTDVLSGMSGCTYTNAGSGSLSLSAGFYVATLSGLTASTAYTVNVTCTDNAGNNQSNNTASFTTSAAAAAASTSTGGGGGSVTSQVAGQFSKVVWESIDADETATVSVIDGEVGITEVRFDASKKLYGMWMKVEKKDSLPSKVNNFDLKVYKYIEITKSLAFREGDMVNPEIDFKIEKSWLTDEGLNKDNLGLFRYVDNEWVELISTINKEDSDYVYYTAETPGFSYFAIGQKSEVSAPSVEELAEEIVGEVSETPEEVMEEVMEEPSKKLIWPWVVLLLIFVIIGIILYFVLDKKVFAKKRK